VPGIWRRQEQFDRAFLAGGAEARLRAHAPLTDDLEAGFRRLILEDYRVTETQYFRTIFCASLAKLTFLESFPDADYPALVAALPPMRHLEPKRMMREMAARGDTDIGPLQRAFPHRSRRELDLSPPRWDEDPEWVAAMLRERRAQPAGNDPRPAYEQARASALAALPWHRRRSFARKLDRLRMFLWLREEMRDVSSRMYHLIRRYVLALAGRRETFESFRNFRAPNEIGSRFAFDSIPASGALRGIGASRGRVKGVARVARTIEEAMGIERGAILVCPFTDPGWTPVLDRVAAVVTETGGLLSHAAVICREYGIPAVLGVPGATTRIPDGATVVVHGGLGSVELTVAALCSRSNFLFPSRPRPS
jgi:pyruvate,water dikinase